MSRPYHPVFPELGWCCLGCKRELAGGNERCPYCRQLVSKHPPPLVEELA